jgi:hypothetical protein
MPLIVLKGVPEEVVVSDCGRLSGVFAKDKCLKTFSCDDFDVCVRDGKPTPQVEALRFVRSLHEAKPEVKPAPEVKPDKPSK